MRRSNPLQGDTDKAPTLIGLLIPFAAAALMVACWPFASDQDLYLHLKTGQMILKTGHPPLSDSFSYTAAGRPEESHAWLSQVIFWLIYQHCGELGLRVLNFILLGGILATLGADLWRKSRRVGLCVLGTSVALLLHQSVQILRPLLFGELFLCAYLCFALGELRPLPPRRLLLCLFIAVLWANLHASVLILVPLFSLYAIALWLDGQRDRLSLGSPLFIGAALCLNPRGLGLFYYGWEVAGLGSRLRIREWLPLHPLQWESGGLGPPILSLSLDFRSLFLIAGLVACAALWRRWSLRPSLAEAYRLGLVTLFILLPFFSCRHGAYLLYPAGFLVAEMGRNLRFPRAETFALTVISVALLVGFRFYESPWSVYSIEKAADFLADSGLEGNVFNDPSWGSYLTYRLYPRIRAAHTMRLQVHRDLLLAEREEYERYGGIRIDELLKRLARTRITILPSWLPIREILSPRDWVIVFENNVATIALRKSSDDGENLRRVALYYRERAIAFDPSRGVRAEEIARVAPRRWGEMLETPTWGWWPKPWVKELWESRQRQFYGTRKLAPPHLS